MPDSLFSNSTNTSVFSNRIIYTSSIFARFSFIHLQETGTLQVTHSHKNERRGLSSCLFFTILRGTGQLTYDGETYDLYSGDCVFTDCKKPYSHEAGSNTHQEQLGTTIDASNLTSELWFLQWVHFYGSNMGFIYHKYQERGGRPVYQQAMPDTLDIQAIKNYFDENFKRHISLNDLTDSVDLNKYYLTKLFKDRYGMTINIYLNRTRVTWGKQQLRFTDKTMEMLAAELQIEPACLNMLFS